MILARKPNREYRSREYLTSEEIDRLLEAAKDTRYPLRNQALILLIFRHGLRISEAIALRWDAVMLSEKVIYITRVKNGISGNHPLQDDEVEILSKLRSQYPASRNVFSCGERGTFGIDGARKLIERLGERADLSLPIHPHMMRHACGYHLANQGLPTRDIQEYLGHRDIRNTVRYTAANPARFNKIQW